MVRINLYVSDIPVLHGWDRFRTKEKIVIERKNKFLHGLNAKEYDLMGKYPVKYKKLANKITQSKEIDVLIKSMKTLKLSSRDKSHVRSYCQRAMGKNSEVAENFTRAEVRNEMFIREWEGNQFWLVGRADAINDDGELIELKTRAGRFKGVRPWEDLQCQGYLALFGKDNMILVEKLNGKKQTHEIVADGRWDETMDLLNRFIEDYF